MYNNISMSRDYSAKDRERERQKAREQREIQGQRAERETEVAPVMFGVVPRTRPDLERRAVTDNPVERVLGSYDKFTKCDKKINMVGVDQQPPTPRPVSDPPAHPPSSNSNSSSSSGGKSSSSQRPTPLQPSVPKPPHPPSTYSHTKNGEVKGNLKGGPGPGPGEGGGGGRRSNVGHGKGVSLPHPKDREIQHIMNEMIPLTRMSAITTPRPYGNPGNSFPFNVHQPSSTTRDHQRQQQSRSGKAADISRNKQSKAFGGGQDLVLSEDSEDEEGRCDSVSSTTGSNGRHQSSFGNPAPLPPPLNNPTPTATSLPPLSPLSPATSPKTPLSAKSSDDSSSSEDSSDDSQSSGHSSEDEQPHEPSPKHPDYNSTWKLERFIPIKKNSSPISLGGVPAGSRNEEPPRAPAKEPPQPREKRQTGPKPPAAGRARQETRGRGRGGEKTGPYDHSSDDNERPRPTPRLNASVGGTNRPTRDSRQAKSRPTITPSSDSDSDIEPPPPARKPPRSVAPPPVTAPPAAAKTVAQVLEKSPKVTTSQATRESPKKTPRKRADTKRDVGNLGATKAESGRSRKPLTKAVVSSDSDSEPIIDVVNTPEKPVLSRVTPSTQSTPSRTPREAVRGVQSPQKSVQASPRFSPKRAASGKNGVKRSAPALSDFGSDDEASVDSRGRGHSKTPDSARDKGALINRTFGGSSNAINNKKDKSSRERDPSETKSKSGGRNVSDGNRKSASSSRERREKSSTRDRSRGASDASSVDGRLGGGVGGSSAAPSSLVNKCRSPNVVVSAEPKVPIPPLQYQNGVHKLLCTIPLSFIDKVPKPSVVLNGASLCKSDVKEESEEYKKKVLDNRTKGGKGGKGKRKTSDGASKAPEDASKQKIILSIFGSKRPDPDSDDDKVKKEIKKEATDSEEEKYSRVSGGKSGIGLPVKEETKEEGDDKSWSRGGGSTRQSSPMSSVSDASTSRHIHRKKKRQERSPSSKHRKRPKSQSEREGESGGESVRQPRGGSQDRGGANLSSRKRNHNRDSSLESIRSQPRGSSKRVRLSPPPPAAPPPPQASPSTTNSTSTATTASTTAPPRTTEKEEEGVGGTGGGGWDSKEENNSSSSHHRSSTRHAHPSSTHSHSSQDKCEESGTTPGAESSTGYSSRPASEHESRSSSTAPVGGGTEPSSAVTPSTVVSDMGAPQRQGVTGSSLGTTTTAAAAAATTTTGAARPSEQDYGQYLRMAKELKHMADGETDRSMQAMKYLEAALYFILSGKTMETEHVDHLAALTMYKDTLKFIKWVSSVFRRENPDSFINTKLAVLSLRCRSLLSLEIYKMLLNEHRDNQSKLNVYFQNHRDGMDGSGQQWNGSGGVSGSGGGGGGSGSGGGGGGGSGNNSGRVGGSPSHLSQTPSPAGSVGSEGSQSSGYTTSTEGTRYRRNGLQHPAVGNTPPHPQPVSGGVGVGGVTGTGTTTVIPTVTVPVTIHQIMAKQHQISSHLASAHDMWMEADHYVFQHSMADFFIELDRHVGMLTLHSSLSDLVYYVQAGLERLKDWTPPPPH